MMSGSGQNKNRQPKLVQTTLKFSHSASGQSSSQEKGTKRRFDNLEMDKASGSKRTKQENGASESPRNSQAADASQSNITSLETGKTAAKDCNKKPMSPVSDKKTEGKTGHQKEKKKEGDNDSDNKKEGKASHQEEKKKEGDNDSDKKTEGKATHQKENKKEGDNDSEKLNRSSSDKEGNGHEKGRESDFEKDSSQKVQIVGDQGSLPTESVSDCSEYDYQRPSCSDKKGSSSSEEEDKHRASSARRAEHPSEGLKHNLKTAPECLTNEKDWLRVPTSPSDRDDHVICFQVPISHGAHGPTPYPPRFIDKWSEGYVRMPCSKENKYPDYEGGRDNLESRWTLIEKTLKPPDRESFEYFIRDSFELQKAILTYNKHNEGKWNFAVLHKYFQSVSEEEKTLFFYDLLPKMCKLALKLPQLCTKPIRLLKKGTQRKITLSQQQIACLLANAFFCTFPRRSSKSRNAEYSNYPDINFNNLFQKGYRFERKLEKLKCILHYFERVCSEPPLGIVTFARQMRLPKTDWISCSETFTKLFVSPEGTIEDDGIGMLQVDFANKYIGGGALNTGLVQEEIRFMICPEMIVSRLFTESLSDNECIIMTGCERFSKYTGYADTFRFAGDFRDETKRDKHGRMFCEVVAIDALVFKDYPRSQFQLSKVDRELNKAYCGFFTHELSKQRPAVCTGNWGCGAFGGDKQLKSLIQLMAATATKREVCYLTFGDLDLSENLNKVHKLLTEKKKTIGDVYKLIKGYHRDVILRHDPRISLFDYIFDKLGDFSSFSQKGSDEEMSSEEPEKRSHTSSFSQKSSEEEMNSDKIESHATNSSPRDSNDEPS